MRIARNVITIVSLLAALSCCHAARATSSNDAESKTEAASQDGSVKPSGPSIRSESAGEVIQQAGIKPRFGEMVPLDAVFVDADGKEVRLGDCFDGRPTILHLVYYECPMLCKLSSDGLLSSLGTLSLQPGKDFNIVTLSFDPREGSEVSARAREMAAVRCGEEAVNKGWRFLTGDVDSIQSVTNAVGFYYVYDENTKQYAHAAGIFVLTPEGKVSRYLGGINFAPRDLKYALVEASDGNVGTALDQVLMLCYMYDPTVGRYGFAIMTIIRVAGVATVIALATFIIVMIRRDRRRQQQVFPANLDLESGFKA